VLGFEPAYTTAEAFADFAGSLHPGFNASDRVLAGLSNTLVGAQKGSQDG